MERWNGKHPTPWDMFYSFNDATGKDLNWFWNNWYFSNHYIDLTLKSVDYASHKVPIHIKNTGGFAIPFTIEVTYESGGTERFETDPGVWEENPKEISLLLPTKDKVIAAKLITGIYVDANESDNVWKK